MGDETIETGNSFSSIDSDDSKNIRSRNNRGSETNMSTTQKIAKCCCNCISHLILRPLFRLMNVKLPVYVIFLGTICFVVMSQIAIMYSNHSIFMKLNDVMDAIHPMQSVLLNGQDFNPNKNQFISTASSIDLSDDAVSEDEPNAYTVGKKEGVFFSNTSVDFRECTSPESHVPWPLEGVVHSKTSGLTCGMQSDTQFSKFFRSDLWTRKFQPMIEKCNKLVVFGVAFGGNFVKDLDAPHVRSLINTTHLEEKHGKCFFILTTEKDVEKNSAIVDKYNGKERSAVDAITIGHNILIPIPDATLPYKNPRRNVKILKYMGQYMFQNAETVIWQDAKFFRDDFVSKQPMNYENLVEDDACVTAVGLPVHKITVGLENIRRAMKKHGRYTAQYEHHCQTIIEALIERPDVTDSSENLIRQCDAYLQHVYKEEGSIDTMNQGLIDSAFIVWNHKTQSCRDFSSAFRCTIVDQIQCHSDRDQVSIPFAMYKMGVSGMYRRHKGEELRKVDRDWDPRIHDLDFVPEAKQNNPIRISGENDKSVMIRVIRSSCHWYFSRLGNCRTDLTDEKPTMAILVAGSAKRYVLEDMSKHLIEPLVHQQNTKVDYYLMLSVKQGLAYRNSFSYMKYQAFDPIFEQIATERDSDTVTAFIFSTIRNLISVSGANVGGIHIQPQPMKLDNVQLRKKQLAAKKLRPKEDSYFRFPTLDLRHEHRRRTAVTNRNVFKLYLGLQKLWDKHLIASETYVGVSYDYVMILREDVLWLDDFNLQKLIDTNPFADAYVLSCDMRDPPSIANEYNDYAIVIKRKKAAVVGKYFEQLLKTDLDACHASVSGMVPEETGCNTGMLLYWILRENHVVVEEVPQSVFPIERVMNLSVNKTRTVCIDKYCQSKDSPLAIPDNLKFCSEMKFEN
mmetsp:Transcript_24076/g.66737  ORF Transcript_24076/g.66737 Transcript_24076/m.66737 type:complete len:904 (+) Transcript_24076:70-2781(+)